MKWILIVGLPVLLIVKLTLVVIAARAFGQAWEDYYGD